MTSIPPAAITDQSPVLIAEDPSMIDFIPEAQTLLIKVLIVLLSSSAPNTAYLSGACPDPAGMTFPINTSSMSSLLT